MNTKNLTVDASNRALRVLIVNGVVDLVSAISIAVSQMIAADPMAAMDWDIMKVLLAKTAAATVGSFLLRRFGDPSKLPTPLPPTPQPAPADPLEPGDKY